MHNDLYMLWLSSLTHQIGSRKLNFLIEHFGSASAVFKSTEEDLAAALPNAHATYKHITTSRSLEYIENILNKMESAGVAYLSRDNPSFPHLLKMIPDPPVGIFFAGTIPADHLPKVAIIGSRKCSEYGLLTARLLARPLAAEGVVIVSGMARGVDSMAHRGALQGGGLTIAVLGCGVDICYPAENRELRSDIIKTGCIISEYAPGVKPTPQFFPARNRIISGLCLGLVVTEASLKSGTLITVDQAGEQGREVLAVPGNISSKLSQGTNQLIKDGAYPVSDHKDIMEILKISDCKSPKSNHNEIKNTEKNRKKAETELAPDQKQVYDKLSLAPISVDTLAEITQLPIGSLYLALTSLEVKGMAKKLPGSRYIKE